MKQYKWFLFDADETLFRFDAFTGLQHTFSQFGVHFSAEDYEDYQAVNTLLWVDYQNGVISAQELQHRRFKHWALKLAIPAQELNSKFLTTMADICSPLEGAERLLNTLNGRVKLGIITNGFTELQQARLERTGLRHHFDLLVISEEVGLAKPHPGIFDHALSFMGELEREHVLMVGDNPDSDILGGLNAGFHTCWLNTEKKPVPEGIVPHYQVASLGELEALFEGS